MYQLYHFSKKLDWADLARYLWAASIFGSSMVIQWRGLRTRACARAHAILLWHRQESLLLSFVITEYEQYV